MTEHELELANATTTRVEDFDFEAGEQGHAASAGAQASVKEATKLGGNAEDMAVTKRLIH